MVQEPQYRTTCDVPLVRIEAFCHALEKVLAARYRSEDVPCIWRLYLSAECPKCGMRVFGDELRALAFPPCAELASAKIGRMRLGDCARSGCNSWKYALHFWHQEGVDWTAFIEAAERRLGDANDRVEPQGAPRFTGLPRLAARFAPRVGAVLSLFLMLWCARQLYQGGRIPFLREPEDFTVETSAVDTTWPGPMDSSEASGR